MQHIEYQRTASPCAAVIPVNCLNMMCAACGGTASPSGVDVNSWFTYADAGAGSSSEPNSCSAVAGPCAAAVLLSLRVADSLADRVCSCGKVPGESGPPPLTLSHLVALATVGDRNLMLRRRRGHPKHIVQSGILGLHFRCSHGAGGTIRWVVLLSVLVLSARVSLQRKQREDGGHVGFRNRARPTGEELHASGRCRPPTDA